MEEKQRMIQEYVPGKQVTLAHLIANPDEVIFEKLGLQAEIKDAVDIATKAADVQVGFVDRFSGSVVMTGDVSSVEAALIAVLQGLEEILGFSSTVVTRT